MFVGADDSTGRSVDEPAATVIGEDPLLFEAAPKMKATINNKTPSNRAVWTTDFLTIFTPPD
jgi:hypothetical protein